VPAHLGAAVAGELDEVEAVEDGDRAREVGEEDETRLEGADEQRLAAGVVAPDLGAELAYARRKLLGGEVDLADPRVRADYDARSRWKCCASRSRSRL
jgi:hypothetical protein